MASNDSPEQDVMAVTPHCRTCANRGFFIESYTEDVPAVPCPDCNKEWTRVPDPTSDASGSEVPE